MTDIEAHIASWRAHLQRRGAEPQALEAKLREQVATLTGAGLAEDEAFLLALKRIGDADAPTHEFAHGFWKQLATAPQTSASTALAWLEAKVALGFAILAALAVKLPELFGFRFGEDEGFYARNFSLFVFPFFAAYFVWKRGATTLLRLSLVAAFVAAAVFANLYALMPAGHLEVLTALHLPVALWLAVGIAYAGGRWSDVAVRMNFVRFSGGLFICYVLIALGGFVLCGLTALMFGSIGVDIEPFFERWMLPCGALGAVIVAAWLVETKQSVLENIAPLLTRLFTPLFVLVLLGFLGTMVLTGRGLEFHRDLLIAFDLLLVVVLGLLLYSIAARDPRQPANAFDVLQVVLVVCALLVDAVALWTIVARISEFGFTPNRVAALGENLILLVNLIGSAVLYLRFLRGGGSFASLERWQTNYLPVYAGWAAFVVIAFPPIFGYM